MKTFIATISITAFAFLSGFAQEMPADLKAKLEAKATELNPDNASKAKTWVSQQNAAWETIQCMAFSIDESDVKLIKNLADKKFPLDYVSQESFISSQAEKASSLPEYKTQLGSMAYNAIRKSFESSDKTSIDSLVETLQNAVTAKMEIDALTTDKIRPRTFALIKRVASEEFPGDFAEQLKTIKEILEGKPADDNVANGDDAKSEKPITNKDLEQFTRNMFATQTYVTDGEKRATTVLTEIQGKRVMLIPASAFIPGITLSNPRGELLEYSEKEIFVSKELPFVIVFPKNLPESYVPAKFINDKQYRELPGTTKYVVGYIKQNIVAHPTKINSINSTQVMLATHLPPNMQEGTMIVDPISKETISLIIQQPLKLRKVNWMSRSEVNRFVRYMESDAGKLQAIRLDSFSKWEKFSEEKYYEQKMVLDRLKQVTDNVLKLFTSSQLSDSMNSDIIGYVIKKHYNGFRSKMEQSVFERKYKAYLMDMYNLIKVEQRKASETEFYSIFQAEVKTHLEILGYAMSTIEKVSKGQAYMNLLHDDLRRMQRL